jgi:hypothetical protein
MFGNLNLHQAWTQRVHGNGLISSSDDLEDFFSETQVRLRLDERKRHAPRTLPVQRQRSLTRDDSGNIPDDRTCHSQTPNSILFRLLPPELRALIWKFVVADGPVIHIARLRGRMVGVVCGTGDPEERFHACWGSYDKLVPGIYLQKRWTDIPNTQGLGSQTSKAVALLTTCRMV